MASIDELIAAADAAASGKGEKKVSTGTYVGNEAKSGLVEQVGGLLDVPARLEMLRRAAIGTVVGSTGLAGLLSRVTGKPESAFLPEVDTGTANFATNKLRGLLGVENMQAPDDTARYLGAAAKGGTGALLGGPISGTLRQLPVDLAKSFAVGSIAGLGAEGGGDVAVAAGAPRELGNVVGGLTTGVGATSFGGIVPAAFRTRQLMDELQAQAKDPANMQKASETASKIVNARLKAAVAGTPNAAQNIDDALELTRRIPGFRPSVPEMAQAQGALEMQRVYARNNPQALNEEVARIQASENALRQHYANVAPTAPQLGIARAGVNQSISDETKALTAQAQQTAGALPVADLPKLGGRLADIAGEELNKARPVVNAAYQKAFNLDRTASIDAAPIVSKIEDTLGTTIAQLKPEVAPNTFKAIQNLVRGEGKTPEELDYIASLVGGKVQNEGAKALLSLEDAAALRRAVTADAALAARSSDPLAKTRLRNIIDVKGVIDDAIAASPVKQEAKDAFAAAQKLYREDFAPRFKEGPNLRIFQDSTANEPRILADKIVGEYFKPDNLGGGTRAENFKRLFGANTEAKELAKEGIIDRFRNAAVDPQTGTINPSKAADFLRTHGRTLEAFKQNGINAVDDINQTVQVASKQALALEKVAEQAKLLNYKSTGELADAALNSTAVMGTALKRMNAEQKDAFVRAIMDKAVGIGAGKEVTGKAIEGFLDKNAQTLNMVLRPEHQSALRDIAKGLSIIEQSPLRGLAGRSTTDPLKEATGVSLATVWSQWRAMTGGRQGVATMGFNLATPVFTKLSQTKFDEVMKTALHDPKTAENLRNLLNATNQQQAGKYADTLMTGLKAAGSALWAHKWDALGAVLGTKNYKANTMRSLPAINSEVQDSARQ